MSYNYEINYDNQKKSLNKSKYTYKNNEIDTQTLIFELVLKDKTNKHFIIRKIKNTSQGNLICPDDNISYCDIKKFKLSVIDINYPGKPIIIKSSINHNMSHTILNDNEIYLEINQNSNYFMNVNYQINMHQ